MGLMKSQNMPADLNGLCGGFRNGFEKRTGLRASSDRFFVDESHRNRNMISQFEQIGLLSQNQMRLDVDPFDQRLTDEFTQKKRPKRRASARSKAFRSRSHPLAIFAGKNPSP